MSKPLEHDDIARPDAPASVLEALARVTGLLRQHRLVEAAPRTLHSLAFDQERGRVVLFGGTSVLAPDAPSHGDTWEWYGARWQRIEVEGPSARDHVAMAYDPVLRAVVLHGGGLGPVDPSETWGWNGRAWTRVSSDGPRRRYARLAFDARSRAMLMFGGFDTEPSNELWRFSGQSTWARVHP